MLYISLSLCLLSTLATLIAVYKVGILSEVLRLYISRGSAISAELKPVFSYLIAATACNIFIVVAILLQVTGGGISAR